MAGIARLHGGIISFSQGFASEISARLVAKCSCTLLLPSFWVFSAALWGKLNGPLPLPSQKK